jgi:hypothetical protein
VTILSDLRSAWRAIRAHAVLSATIAAILAVAIGANTAVFALVNAVMLSPLPFPDAARLVTVDQTRPDSAREPCRFPTTAICAIARARSTRWPRPSSGART